jgi:hypothetical protein
MQGTRASARLRGRNPPPDDPEPAPIKPKAKRGKRKRESDGKSNTFKPPEKMPKKLNDQKTPNDGQPADHVPNENATAGPVPDKNTTADQVSDEQPADATGEESDDSVPSEPFTAEERARLRNRRFFLQMDRGRYMISLGTVDGS